MGPPTPSPAVLLMALGRRVRSRLDEQLAELDVSMRHVAALGHLAREPGLSYSELARRGGVAPQSMQAALRHLEGLGAVERRTEPGRGRTAQLHVTAAGTRLLTTSTAAIEQVDEALRARLGADADPVALALFRLLDLA